MLLKFNFKILGIMISACTILYSCSKNKGLEEKNTSLATSKSNIISMQTNVAGEQTITRRINATSQGFVENWNSLGNYTYGNDPSYIIGMYNLPSAQYHLYRCKFEHPDIPNNKITNVRLNLTIQPSIYSSNNPSYVQVQIPYASCNNPVPWGTPTQAQYASLKSCIENAYLVTTYSVASNALQAFYQRDINSTSSPNLSALLQNETNFTFGMFSILSNNAVKIASVTVDVTYTATSPTGTFASMAGIDLDLGSTTNTVYFWDRLGKVTNSNLVTVIDGQPQNYTLPSGKNYADIIDVGIANTHKSYVWYKDGTMSVGNSITNLGNYIAPKNYVLPAGKIPSDIVGIAISGYNGHCYAFYKNGTFSEGNSTDLGAYSGPQSYAVPPGKTYTDIVSIGNTAVTVPLFVAWYSDNTVSTGPATNLAEHYLGEHY